LPVMACSTGSDRHGTGATPENTTRARATLPSFISRASAMPARAKSNDPRARTFR
jgi:hypothetical protein